MVGELKDLIEKGLFSRVSGLSKKFSLREFDVRGIDGSQADLEETTRV